MDTWHLKYYSTVSLKGFNIMRITCIFENLLVVASLENGSVSKVSLAKPYDKPDETISDLTREQVYKIINSQHDARIMDWDSEIETVKHISDSIKENMKDIVVLLNNGKANSRERDRLNKLYNSLSRELKVFNKRNVTAEKKLYELKELGAAESFKYPVGYWDI